MPKGIAAAALALMGLSACNPSENVLESAQSPEHPVLTLADVVPVIQPQTQQEKDAQQAFLQENTGKFKSRQLAADYYVALGRQELNRQHADSAALSFGNAWLMDSTNSDVYWGYGRLYGQQQQYDKALFILYRALEGDPENPQLLTDIATSHLGRFYGNSNPDDLQQSRKLLEQALTLSPTGQADTYYKLALSSYYLQDYGKAWEYLHKSLVQDKTLEDESFIAALLEKQQDPMGIYNSAVNVQ